MAARSRSRTSSTSSVLRFVLVIASGVVDGVLLDSWAAPGSAHHVRVLAPSIVTVLGLVGGAPEGETPRVADSSAADAIVFAASVLQR